MHAHGKAKATPDVGPIGRLGPRGVAAPLPADGALALGHALLEATGGDHGYDLGVEVALAEAGCDVDRVADAGPVEAAELDGVHSELGGNVLEPGWLGRCFS